MLLEQEQSLPLTVFMPVKNGCYDLEMPGSQCIFRLVGLLSPPPKLYFTSPQTSAKEQGRNRKNFDPQLGRFPMAAACRENQHKFYLGVLHWPPEIHLTHLEGEAFELLLLILAFGTIRSLFTEHVSLWGASHYLEQKASILTGNRVAPKCYRGLHGTSWKF